MLFPLINRWFISEKELKLLDSSSPSYLNLTMFNMFLNKQETKKVFLPSSLGMLLTSKIKISACFHVAESC